MNVKNKNKTYGLISCLFLFLVGNMFMLDCSTVHLQNLFVERSIVLLILRHLKVNYSGRCRQYNSR